MDKPQVADTIYEGEYWLRCPHCGDSDKTPDKAHYSIRIRDGVYHCLRCGASGQLSRKQYYELMAGMPVVPLAVIQDNEDDDEVYLTILEALQPGPGVQRPSLLQRFNFWDNNHSTLWDAFLSYDVLMGDETGLLLRTSGENKRAYFYGERSYSWFMAHEGHPPGNGTGILRVVEGPYDVVTPKDICVFGMISKHNLIDLFGYQIVLCPDGDVWRKPDLYKSFKSTLRYLMFSKDRKPYLLGVEYISEGKDPDEVLPQDRTFFSREYVMRLLND